ncbi:zinc finger, CCHC-type containing protein [Tanacetum coccineum]
MGDENPIRTLGDYSKPSHEGYRNTIELPIGNNVVPLRSDTIRLVQNGCSFHGLRSEDPNQHLKDFLKLVDSLDLDGENRERTRLRLFQFSLRDQASNWLEHLPAGSITTWEDLTTRFLAQFFPPGRTAKLRNDILMFQQHHGESLSEAWTRFKDLLQKVNNTTQKDIDYAAGGRLRKLRPDEDWDAIERLSQYENEGWNDAFTPDEVSLDYENPDIKQLLGIMERIVDRLMKDAILLMRKSESVFRLTTNEVYRPPSEPSRQEEFEHIDELHLQPRRKDQTTRRLHATRENHFLQINELDEMRIDAYANSISYKEWTKRWHEKRIKAPTNYEKGDKVLLFNSRLSLFPGKLKSRWYGPFSVCKDMKNGVIELYDEDGNRFIVNKQRVKPYQKSVLNTNKDDDITLDDDGEVTCLAWMLLLDLCEVYLPGPVMAISVISVSSDSSEESVGTSTG